MNKVFLTLRSEFRWWYFSSGYLEDLRDLFWGSCSPLVSGDPQGARPMLYGNLVVLFLAAAYMAPHPGPEQHSNSTAWAESVPPGPPEAPITHCDPSWACGLCSTSSPGRTCPVMATHLCTTAGRSAFPANRDHLSFFCHLEAAPLYCVPLFSKGPHNRPQGLAGQTSVYTEFF